MPFLPGSVYPTHVNRRMFIGGSDARIIMGQDEATLVRLWREKRGEAEPPDYSGNLLVQLGLITEPLNRRWFEKTTGQAIKEVQTWIRHPVLRWMADAVVAKVDTNTNIMPDKSKSTTRIDGIAACINALRRIIDHQAKKPSIYKTQKAMVL